MKSTLLGAICLSLAASIWGGMYVVSKYVLEYVPPTTLVWWRYLIAFAVLYPLLKSNRQSKEKPSITRRDWKLFLWIGFIGYFVSICLQFIGTKLSDAHTASLVTSATPAFIVVFARIVLKEQLTARKLIALILSTIGVLTIIGWDGAKDGGSSLWGGLSLVGAALTWALLSVYVKVASERQQPLAITTYAVFFALLFTTPLMLWEIQSSHVYFSLPIFLGILYLGVVSTAGAFFLWNKGMDLMDAGIGSLFFFFQPVVGAFLGWLLLHEQLEPTFFIGGVFILVGVLVATVQKS